MLPYSGVKFRTPYRLSTRTFGCGKICGIARELSGLIEEFLLHCLLSAAMLGRERFLAPAG